MLEIVFFDVGSVLFNDDPQAYVAYKRFHDAIVAEHPDFSFEQMLRMREQLAQQGKTWNLHTIASQYLSDDQITEVHNASRNWLEERFDEHHLPNPDVEQVLRELSKSVRLAVLANQPAEAEASLERRGLLKYFDTVIISEVVDLYKPDPKLYEYAATEAGVSPEKAVMVGDRLDNDVAPAQSIGMKTIWLSWPNPLEKNWHPPDSDGRAFLESCARTPLFVASSKLQATPDATVSALIEIPPIIHQWCSGE